MSGKGPPPPPPKREPAAAAAAEVHVEEEVPVSLENGVSYEGECVAPDCYRWYTATVQGDPDVDLAKFNIELHIQEGSANVFANKADKDWFPEKDDGSFDWNVKRGQLVGPPGTYNFSVYGVPSFIDNDTAGFLQGENANWAKYNLYVDWVLMDEQELQTHNSVAQKFSSRKESIFDSSFQDAAKARLAEEEAELEAEQAALEARFEADEAARGQVDVSGTVVTEKYDIGRLISPGDFSNVFSATSKADSKEVALKIFSKSLLAEMHISAQSATALAQKCGGKVGTNGAIEILETLETNDAFVVAMPIYPQNLATFVSSRKGYSEKDARAVVKSLFEALASIQSKNVLHRAVMPAHLLVGEDAGKLHVAFTGWCLAEESASDVVGTGGEPAFQAPEVMKNQDSGKAADVWSCGVVAFLAVTGSLPFNETNSMKLYSKITNGEYAFPSGTPKGAEELIKQILVVDASKRPSVADVLKHAWFSGSEDAALASDIGRKIQASLH